MHDLVYDLRHAVRSLTRRPVFLIAATLTLAIGIGASTAIFSLVNAVVFKGVPGLEAPAGLVEITRDLDGEFFDVSYPVFTHWRESATTTSDMAAPTLMPLSLDGDPEPTVHTGFAVTGNYFSVLGLRPSVGRFSTLDQPFHPRVGSEAVLSHDLWPTRFDADPGIVGSLVRINGYPTTVIGVGPREFRGHRSPLLADVFVPLWDAGAWTPKRRGTERPLPGREFSRSSGVSRRVGVWPKPGRSSVCWPTDS